TPLQRLAAEEHTQCSKIPHKRLCGRNTCCGGSDGQVDCSIDVCDSDGYSVQRSTKAIEDVVEWQPGSSGRSDLTQLSAPTAVEVGWGSTWMASKGFFNPRFLQLRGRLS
ncbi:hypothetical protein CLAIMM_13527, partial [Cladophialophora immunda]